ncbi:MAG: methyl-accepting chemotaxis protein [Bacillota bacterium]|nr:methyl-accepting chemotaxis protein [Bacillota bacterium]
MNLKTVGYDLRRVSTVNLTVLFCAGFVILLEGIIYNGFSQALMENLIKIFVVLGVSSVLYFLPVKEQIKGGVFCIIMSLIALETNMEKTTISSFMLLMLAFSMSALYFQKELVLIVGGFIDIVIIITFIVQPSALANNTNAASGFTRIMVYFNVAVILIFFLTKWGRELVDSVTKKEKQTDELLNRLKLTMNKISSVSDVFEVDLNGFSENIKVIKESNDNIMSSIKEVSLGVQEQAENIGKISNNMLDASDLLNQSKKISGNVSGISSEMVINVEDGSKKINNVNDQMRIINKSVITALDTVAELEESIEEIGNFLQGITQIANQTNLLSLNASIEAARAGENGRGFAVVADEVRKLAEESAAIVTNINKITQEITEKTKLTSREVKDGVSAIEKGNELISDVNYFFGELKDICNRENQMLKDEVEITQKVFGNFITIKDEVESISAIAEQNSAANEEFLASIENQNADMTNMLIGVKTINSKWDELKGMLADN